MASRSAPLAISVGEPAGIGPEISLSALAKLLHDGAEGSQFCLLGDRHFLEDTAKRTNTREVLRQVAVRHHPLPSPVVPGVLNPLHAAHVLALLDDAIEGCLHGHYRGMVTAPVHKGVINQSGVVFSGHTEYLAERTGTSRVVMLLTAEQLAPPLRVALATTHVALKDVAPALNVAQLFDTLRILDHDLRTRFSLSRPRIAVCGLNPHAGEGGYLGREEIDIISPAIERAQQSGLDVTGPWPADTLFHVDRLRHVDAVLAMYHDQGLPVLKFASFGAGVNITLGLPFVRTSVDHGTALDLAGTGRANSHSMVAALQLALQLTNQAEIGSQPHARS